MTDAQAVHASPVAESEPCGDLCIRTLAMPADTNANGDIFGGWQAVSPRYCGVQAQYAPPARVYDDTPRCMRSRSYDPRRGTFIGRDGYERPCP